MVYKTLYRVYRPQKFEDVAGQEHIMTTLKHAIEVNKISHAYLFCGPRGTGKTSIAKLLAKAINCSGTGDIKPCDECENCQSIAEGNHPDVIEIDAASHNGVDEVRYLIDKVKYAPTQGQYKVYIIDEVHMMSTGAFNALLKTLEEPPAHVVFILATTEPHKILPTIISRCQRFDFSKLSIQEMIERMKQVIYTEGYQCEDEALELIAKLAEGGMRDALSILEQCLSYNDENLTVDDIYQIYGMISIEQKIDLIKVILSKDMKTSLHRLNDMKIKGIDIKRLTLDLVDILKDVIIYRQTNDLTSLFVLSQHHIELIVPFLSYEEAFSFIDILMDANEKYGKISNPSLYFELAVLKMCSQTEQKTIPVNHINAENSVVQKEPVIEVTEEPESILIESEENIQDVSDNTLGEDTIETHDDEVDTYVTKEDSEIYNDEQEVPTFEFEKNTDVEEDVSRDIQISEDDVLNILVQAKREVLERIQERWPIIKRYLANLNTAKSAGMLCDGVAVAASDSAVIIAFEFQPAVNAVNYYKNYKQLSTFLAEILGQEFKFIAIQQEAWIQMRSRFIELKKNDQLPMPREVTLKHIDVHDLNYVDMSEAQEFAVELFGDIVEFKEEEE